MWFLSVAVIRGVAIVTTVIIVVVILSFMELLVCKKSLYFLSLLFLIYYNGRLKFVNKGFKVI